MDDSSSEDVEVDEDQLPCEPPDQPPSESVILAGYQAALGLMTYEGNLIWTRYNAMLVANAIIVAVQGSVLGKPEIPGAALKALSVGGFFLCVIWLLVTVRGFDYYRYWIWSARELEEKHLGPSVQTVSRGGRFADGQTVSLTIDNVDRQLRLYSKGLSVVKTRITAYAVIGVFAALHIFLFQVDPVVGTSGHLPSIF